MSNEQLSGRVIQFPGRGRRGQGLPPTTRFKRDAKLAAIPVAYAGRRAKGLGQRMIGKSPAEIDLDIQVRTAEHLVDVLGDLRGCAAKVGQMASVYRTAMPLVPLEFGELAGDALGRLQTSAPPMMPALVHQVLAENLGPGWREEFREFNERPAAAASLGQVHRAVWRDGRAVAVKVMYPGARKAVDSDLRLLRSLSGVIAVFMPGADVAAVIETVCGLVDDELDYHREAAHQQACADAFADDPQYVVPNVVAHTDEVLISDWVEGISVNRLISGGSPHERGRLGLLIFHFLEEAIHRAGVLYSDVHPGNFLVLPDGRLAVVDFGACEDYPQDMRSIVIELGEVVYNGTPAQLEEALRRHGFVRPEQDFDAEELLRIVTPFRDVLIQEDFRMSSEWLREQVDAIAVLRLSNVFRQMTLPPQLTAFARKVGTTIGTLSLLGTDGLGPAFLRWWPEVAESVRRFENSGRVHS
ncbi:ABC1 kinase family protein [Nocardia uniformis]|uniref:ABC1 kinase family protein n=1 Tax=Nocardia uniformis TaxID=53432 RepID=UPI00082CF143|nr:AarF/ABC1/UbiB kinase family protein [Nocardia uniformis]